MNGESGKTERVGKQVGELWRERILAVFHFPFYIGKLPMPFDLGKP